MSKNYGNRNMLGDRNTLGSCNTLGTEAERIKALWDDLKAMGAEENQLFNDCVDTIKYKNGILAEIWLGYIARFQDLSAVMITIKECEVLA